MSITMKVRCDKVLFARKRGNRPPCFDFSSTYGFGTTTMIEGESPLETYTRLLRQLEEEGWHKIETEWHCPGCYKQLYGKK